MQSMVVSKIELIKKKIKFEKVEEEFDEFYIEIFEGFEIIRN